MTPITTVFWGTHDFAAGILTGLIADPMFNIVGVVTQPDKPVGRKKTLTAPPTKLLALRHKIAVYQPESLKTFTPPVAHDIAIVAQYGKIIPERLLSFPTHDTLNVHTSLLPAYRGATPVQTAIADGATSTGVTIMKMDKGMDTGPLLTQREISIGSTDTTPEIYTKLLAPSIEALHESVPSYLNGTLLPQVQDESLATTCKLLSREDGRIDWSTMTAQTIYNHLRGYTPWPGIWTTLNDKRLKILSCTVSSGDVNPATLMYDDDKLLLGTIEGSLKITTLQIEGKPPMTAKQFMQGYRQFHGMMCV